MSPFLLEGHVRKKAKKAAPRTISIELPKVLAGSRTIEAEVRSIVSAEADRLVRDNIHRMARSMARKVARDLLEQNRAKIEKVIRVSIEGLIEIRMAEIKKNLNIEIDW